MADAHDRSAHVLDPAYLAALDARTVEELRTKHAECLELETEVSYVRRLTQARIDILEAEIERRGERRVARGPHRRLPGDPRRHRAAREPGVEPPAACRWRPSRTSEWAPDLERFDGVLANLPTLSDDELDEAIDGLRALERDVSDERRALFAVIDRIDARLGDAAPLTSTAQTAALPSIARRRR